MGNQVRRIKYCLPWFCALSFFSIALDGDMVLIFPPIPKFVFDISFWASQLFLVLIFVKHASKFKINFDDLVFIILVIFQIWITIKNYGLSESSRNFFIIFSMIFYFYGRYSDFSVYYKKETVFLGVILSILISILSSVLLKVAFFTQTPGLLLFGANISGGMWNGVFLGRATGLYTSPLTLSGFILIGVMLSSYLLIEKKSHKILFLVFLFGLILTLSRGTFIACFIYFALLLFKKIGKLKARTLTGSIVALAFTITFLTQKGYIDLGRLLAKSSLDISTSTRISNHTNHFVEWSSNPISIIIGDNSNSMGIDSDVLNYIFNYGAIVTAVYILLFSRLLLSKSTNDFHTYLKFALIAKLVDGLFSGSALGMPSIMIFFYYLGLWTSSISRKKAFNPNLVPLIQPEYGTYLCREKSSVFKQKQAD